MNLVETEAVVLHASDYGESDRIVTFFTLTSGLVRAMAKGARRSRKRFVHAFESHSVVRLSFRQRKGLGWVESCRLLEGNLALRCDPSRWAYAGLLGETTLRLHPEHLPNPQFYALLCGALARLGIERDPVNVAALFLVRGIHLVGGLPSLESCGQCGQKLREGSTWSLSLGTGRFACPTHAMNHTGAVTLDQGSAVLLQVMLQGPVEKIWRFRLRKGVACDLVRAGLAWVEEQTGQQLKSRRLLNCGQIPQGTEESRP
ncbi:DNA repair protein RecO [Desulfosoma sp.]|uniref:DNA repair protein RecO n=1 Tax=Desulfosoma sp. TaxID=2603217 RepID=UPI00404919D5